MQKTKSRLCDLKKNLVVLLISALFCFFVMELAVRQIGDYDIDGQFIFRGRFIKPYSVQYSRVGEVIDAFEKIERPYLIPNPYLGWAINNNSEYPNGYYKSNSMGLRSDREFNLTKGKDVLRIALFGDSFVHGDDVYYNQSWAYYLERKLIKNGVNAEIMNFGVCGYGNDQAYLRWKLYGRNYKPDIVIIGFQPENCKRNLNIIRQFYVKSEKIFPYFKPRFILDKNNRLELNNGLELVNYPTLDYRELPNELKKFKNSSLSKYEYFYNPGDFSKTNPLYFSKMISTFLTYFEAFIEYKYMDSFYKEGSNGIELCYKIVTKFYREASEESDVFIIHIPTRIDLKYKLKGKNFIYEHLLSRFKRSSKLIDPTNKFISEARKTSLDSLGPGHYSAKANKIVADSIYEALQNKTLE